MGRRVGLPPTPAPLTHHSWPRPACLPCSLSTACISQAAGGATPAVCVVFGLDGEVAACVADVGLLERALLPPLLRQPHVAAALAAAPVLMLDGNLAEPALEVWLLWTLPCLARHLRAVPVLGLQECAPCSVSRPTPLHPPALPARRRRAARPLPPACPSGLSQCQCPSRCAQHGCSACWTMCRQTSGSWRPWRRRCGGSEGQKPAAVAVSSSKPWRGRWQEQELQEQQQRLMRQRIQEKQRCAACCQM